MNSMKYFGVNIVSAGVMNPSDDSYEIISEHHGDIYKKVVVKNGLITGLIFAGDIEKSGIVYNLMKDRVNVDSFKEFLIADDLSLASLPEQIRQVKLAIPSSASIIAPFPAEQLEEAVLGE